MCRKGMADELRVEQTFVLATLHSQLSNRFSLSLSEPFNLNINLDFIPPPATQSFPPLVSTNDSGMQSISSLSCVYYATNGPWNCVQISEISSISTWNIFHVRLSLSFSTFFSCCDFCCWNMYNFVLTLFTLNFSHTQKFTSSWDLCWAVVDRHRVQPQ